MWTKQPQAEVPSYSPSPVPPSQTTAAPSQSTNYAARPSAPSARSVACLGETIEVKGKISGEEDLQVDGKVEGPISLQGQRLTVGRTGKLNSEIAAREVVVYGNVHGNVRASDRVEIKKDGSVTGDVITARISIEDGAFFKGRIEIERGKQTSPNSERESELVSAGAAAD
ncbi:MAG: polymer-forming cytoskeletal protein [Candidatus Acidiferrales bacterium]|jgi:cytoskeletal protein CcmA (bactofilin family)